MKKLFIIISAFLLLSASFVFADEAVKGASLVTPKDTIPSHAFFDVAHICTSTSTNCKEPEKYTYGIARAYVVFWAPASQVYARHYIITDMAGTLVRYHEITSALSSGWIARYHDFSGLPAGFYTLTVILVGADGRAAVSQPYTFRQF